MALTFTFPIEPDEKYKGRITFKAFNTNSRYVPANQSIPALGYAGGGVTTVTEPGDTVNLYLPQGISLSDQVGYENTDLGIIGSAIRSGSNAVFQGAGARQIASDASSTIDRIRNSIFGTEGKAYLASLAERFGGAAVAAGTEITANPHRRSIFQDVALRQFSFEFVLQPMSREEADVSEEIVRFFRSNLYPEEVAAGSAYKFPSKFKIRFTYDNQPVATKLLPCYLTSVQTTYNPNSSSFHEGGKFTSIGISLAFQEETALTKQLVNQGF